MQERTGQGENRQLHPDGIHVLGLVTDAYGGTGGIAKYNRDFFEAVLTHPAVSRVTVVPRVISRDIQAIPRGLEHASFAAHSKPRFARAVFRFARSSPKPGLVVCGHMNLLPLAWAAASLARAPMILLTYGIEAWENKSALHRWMIRRAAGVISISNHTLRKMDAWAGIEPGREFILPNAVDIDTFTAQAPNPAFRARMGAPDGPLLLTLGRMERTEQAKGFDEVLEAMPELLGEFPNLQYCAAGDGNDRPRLQKKAVALGLGDRVHFPGYIDEADKPGLYSLADAFVMPSRLEGFGYVFLEALASGVPVVASVIDGSREAVRDGRLGILVDPRDRADVVSGIRSALISPRVPPREELEYFSRARFESRCHAILDTLLLPATRVTDNSNGTRDRAGKVSRGVIG